jgi:hypothetical protein
MFSPSIVPRALSDSGKRGKVLFSETDIKLGVGIFRETAKEPHLTESGHYQRHGGEPLACQKRWLKQNVRHSE